jgi:SulP family sulfate permease
MNPDEIECFRLCFAPVVLQILVGVFKLVKFIRLVPHPVMFGFVNGLAIMIFMSQLEQFKNVVTNQTVWLSGNLIYVMLV